MLHIVNVSTSVAVLLVIFISSINILVFYTGISLQLIQINMYSRFIYNLILFLN